MDREASSLNQVYYYYYDLKKYLIHFILNKTYHKIVKFCYYLKQLFSIWM